MVALLDATDKSYVAGGALIALHVVISVRQKIDDMNPEQLLVRAGEWDFKTETEHYRHVDAEVKQIVRHPDFDMDSGANNVALLFLKRSLKASIHINPICLPEGPKNFDLSRCIFTAWGKKSFEDFTHMNIMKKIELPVVQSSTCQHAISQYLGGEFVLHNSLMCAGGEKDKDSCMGDGGSPLACPRQDDPERYELAGLVNFGVQCGIPGVPGVYVNVANLRQWINRATTDGPLPDEMNSFDQGHYEHVQRVNPHRWTLNEADKNLAYSNGNGQNGIIGQHNPVNNIPPQPVNPSEFFIHEPNPNHAFGNGYGQNGIIGQHNPVNNIPFQPVNPSKFVVHEANPNHAYGNGNAQNNFGNRPYQQIDASAQGNNQRDQDSGNSENLSHIFTSTMGYELN